MPTYRYECNMCEQTFQDFKPMHARHNVLCPCCGADGNEFTPSREDPTHRVRAVALIMPRNVQAMKDWDRSEGRNGESVEMPSLGPGVRISSRSQFKEATSRAREKLYRDTDGEHRTLRPFKDPGTGKITHDYVTVNNTGFDIGEIVPLEERKDTNEIMSAFEEGKTLRETEESLARDLGDAPAPKPKGRKKAK